MTATIEEFPAEGRKHLDSIYQSNRVKLEDVHGKIGILRKMLSMESTVIAADNGINDDATELRALEFYELDRAGFIS